PPTVGRDDLVVTFVGHATFLIQVGAINLLTDPVYAERASPVSFAGPRRVRAPGVRFDDLPAISLVLVSHNHYDHCDLGTLRALPGDRRAAGPHRPRATPHRCLRAALVHAGHPHESGRSRAGAPRSRSAPEPRDAFRHVSIDAGGNRRTGSRIGQGVAGARGAGGAVSDGGRRGVGRSAPRRTRTPSLLIRSQALYPVELWARNSR